MPTRTRTDGHANGHGQTHGRTDGRTHPRGALTRLLAAVELRVLGTRDVPAGTALSARRSRGPAAPRPAPALGPRPAHILSFWCCRFPMAASRRPEAARCPPAPPLLPPCAAPNGSAGNAGGARRSGAAPSAEQSEREIQAASDADGSRSASGTDFGFKT